jgi:hypothetical protein
MQPNDCDSVPDFVRKSLGTSPSGFKRVSIQTKKWIGKRVSEMKLENEKNYLSRFVRSTIPSLQVCPSVDPKFRAATKFVKRCHDGHVQDHWKAIKSTKSRRKISGSGSHPRLPELRLALFSWFVDVRTGLRGRLPRAALVAKAKAMYSDYVAFSQQHNTTIEKLSFSKSWVKGWEQQFQISLKKPNKTFKLSFEVRKSRILQFLKNIVLIRTFMIQVSGDLIYFSNFTDTISLQNFGVDPEIVSADQMPLHRNEQSGQRTLSFSREATIVKENHTLSRERCTVMTTVSSAGLLPLEMLFKGKGQQKRTQVSIPKNSNLTVQWAEKGSYRLENILKFIEKLRPNNPNDARTWKILTLDDYSVHLHESVSRAALEKGYIPVIYGGGITGDLQVNDTHIHHLLKSLYRRKEAALLLSLLQICRNKIPTPSRHDQAEMICESWSELTVNLQMAYKNNFLTNALDGSEDCFVSRSLWRLVGNEIVQFRQHLKLTPPKSIQEMLSSITKPEGTRHPHLQSLLECPIDEGNELMDGDFDFEEEAIETPLDQDGLISNADALNVSGVEDSNDQPHLNAVTHTPTAVSDVVSCDFHVWNSIEDSLNSVAAALVSPISHVHLRGVVASIADVRHKLSRVNKLNENLLQHLQNLNDIQPQTTKLQQQLSNENFIPMEISESEISDDQSTKKPTVSSRKLRSSSTIPSSRIFFPDSSEDDE